MIRVMCCFALNGATQGFQGQVVPQVHQENGGDIYLCQEKARKLNTVLATMRKAAAKIIEPPPHSVHNKNFIGKKIFKNPNKMILKYITQEHITQKVADWNNTF